LHRVLRSGDVAEREVHGAVQRTRCLGRGERGAARIVERRDRIGTEQVAGEAVADLGDGGAGEQRRGPQLFLDHVMDQHPDVPAGTRRRRRPPVTDAVCAGRELVDRAAEQAQHVVVGHGGHHRAHFA
jgi:hypothetical protein